MARLEYLQDLHYNVICKEVLGVGSLTNPRSANFWTGIDKKIQEKYGASLTAHVLYEHHFNKEKSLSEIADEIDVSKQGLDALAHKLNLPVRNLEESYAMKRRGVKISNSLLGKIPSEETLILLSKANRGNDSVRPSDAELVEKHLKGIRGYVLANECSVANSTMYRWLRNALHKHGYEWKVVSGAALIGVAKKRIKRSHKFMHSE
ncbi:hypothetical protein HYV89_02360 [Candidatus Woesearchaeota archaeon]|nr:hypothetical protein [Candidatus Woesearchaeota archaeon]